MSSTQALLERSVPFSELKEAARSGQMPLTVTGLTPNAKAHVASALGRDLKRPVIYIAPSEQEARDLSEQSGGAFLPDADVLLRNVAGKSRENEMERLKVLKEADHASVVFMSVKAALQRVVPREVFDRACISLKTGQTWNIKKLLRHLSENCYERVATVYSKGEFAMRGEVLDIYPADAPSPLRITWFDDQIESIRYFNSETQKSVGKPISAYALPPARETVLPSDEKKKLTAALQADGGSLSEELLDELEQYGSLSNIDSMLSLFYPAVSPVDYFPDALLVFDDLGYVREAADRLTDDYEGEYEELAADQAVLPFQKDGLVPLAHILDSREKDLIDAAGFTQGSLTAGRRFDLSTREAQPFNGRIDMLADVIRDRTARGYHLYLFAGRKSTQLAAALADQDLEVPVLRQVTGREKVAIVPERLARGFEIDDRHILLFGQEDIFGRAKKRVVRKSRRSVGDNLFNDLKPGDIVVHDAYGKGRYLGLKTMKAAGVVGEYMEIEYRDGDRLYVGTDRIDVIQKYIGSIDEEVRLSKLGGSEWENAKARARESTRKLAFDMMKLYSQRFSGTGHAFSPDTVWQREFEDAFPYEETDGQKESTEEIKRDMESPRVMDRLLLGDVGYGKTEVAMRAAFKAVMDGKQVAVLVPTTLLARQHLQTFQERFKNFPVRIAGLSRLGKADHADTLRKLKEGSVDIIIGTHRLLSGDVAFHDLGLLIVDEEQRFGVNHKEKLKTLRADVDVLTLSATPIPRTLEMSLTGIRDMSTIETPPVMKKTAHTYVTRYSDGLLHEAVTREMKRGGQVFLVCRQISEMDALIADVRRIAPHARVAAAHGRMNEKEMENIVSDFIDGGYDVLVCTTIVENGIDIPNVNTIIVYEADKFGLSQLYQLKGRVGRSDRTAYAYFTFRGSSVVNEDARRRLQAIREFTELGSGFKIAMRDLQIRGAGNLLGADQSGHMATVGYAMYCRLMNEAVQAAKGVETAEPVSTTVSLGLAMLVPDSYVSDATDKMDIYRQIAAIGNVADARSVLADIQDRHGKLPPEINNLVLSALIRAYAQRAGASSVVRRSKEIEVKFAPGSEPDLAKLSDLAKRDPEHVVPAAKAGVPGFLYRTDKLPGRDFLELLASLAHPKGESEKTAPSAAAS